jgi:uncharacterized SAM-binding protein YcdF (DUF218 family)
MDIIYYNVIHLFLYSALGWLAYKILTVFFVSLGCFFVCLGCVFVSLGCFLLKFRRDPSRSFTV